MHAPPPFKKKTKVPVTNANAKWRKPKKPPPRVVKSVTRERNSDGESMGGEEEPEEDALADPLDRAQSTEMPATGPGTELAQPTWLCWNGFLLVQMKWNGSSRSSSLL